MQTSPADQYQNTVDPREKIGQRSKWMYPQRRHRDGHKAYEKMLSIAVREMPIKLQQGISSPPQNDHPQNIYKDSMLQRRGEQGGLLHCGQGWKWVGAATRKTVWRFLKTLNIVATR